MDVDSDLEAEQTAMELAQAQEQARAPKRPGKSVGRNGEDRRRIGR